MSPFFHLLQISLGNEHMFPTPPTDDEWQELFDIAVRQTLVGITFHGVQQLPPEQRPPRALLLQWYMQAEKIKQKNADMDRTTLRVSQTFAREGFPNLILKGQGIAQLYPSPLSELRTPGDIDIWLLRDRATIVDYVLRHFPDSQFQYHHVDFPAISEAPIEVHSTPSWMNSYFTNRRLQRFFLSAEQKPHPNPLPRRGNSDIAEHLPDEDTTPLTSNRTLRILERVEGLAIDNGGNSISPKESHKSGSNINKSVDCRLLTVDNSLGTKQNLPTPTLSFNRVYILVHIYRHLFHEGIGLRQLLDYYHVLHQGFTEAEREETLRVLRSLKMLRFTRAVMYVLQQVFGLSDQYLLTTPDEYEGRFLLEEIMLAGNFGQYDERIQRHAHATEWQLFVRRVTRNLRFLHSYPSEVLWSPLFKVWHYFYRRR